MIKIIVGTNRNPSVSEQIAWHYSEILRELGQPSEIVHLSDLPPDFIFSALYENNGKNEAFNRIHEQVKSGTKYVFIVPEYNHSYPGILKAFIDGMTYPNSFRHKKCAMVGLSSGIGGGSIAMSHLTDVFHYLGMHVLAFKPRLAKIEENMSGNLLTNRLYLDLLREQAELLIAF